jgi:hypothetical protein
MRKHVASSLLPLLILIVTWGCSDDPGEVIVDPGGGGSTFDTKTCLGCHSSEEALKVTLGSQPQVAVIAADDG